MKGFSLTSSAPFITLSLFVSHYLLVLSVSLGISAIKLLTPSWPHTYVVQHKVSDKMPPDANEIIPSPEVAAAARGVVVVVADAMGATNLDSSSNSKYHIYNMQLLVQSENSFQLAGMQWKKSKGKLTSEFFYFVYVGIYIKRE